MTADRLGDYLEHIRQAATHACQFVEGLDKDAFLSDLRTQKAVTMSLVIMGEAATKIMTATPNLCGNIQRSLGARCAACAIELLMATSI